jgi:hypothetical protein
MKRILLSVALAAAVRFTGIVYSFVIIGAESRALSPQNTANLLVAYNFLAPLGLVQAGMAALVLRAALASHLKSGSIVGTREIGESFRLSALVGTAVIAAVVALLLGTEMQFLIPAIVVTVLGFVCAVADQVWLGTEKGWIVSLCTTLSLVVMTTAFFASKALGTDGLSIATVIIYCVPPVASMLSFSLKLGDRDFRDLIFGKEFISLKTLGDAFPMLLVSALSAMMVALPVSSRIWPSLPEVSAQETPFLRLSTILAGIAVVLLAPALPALVRVLDARFGRVATGPRLGTAALGVVLIATAALLFSAASPPFVSLWLGVSPDGTAETLGWGIVMALWVAAAVIGQITLMTCDTRSVAAMVAVACSAIFVVMLVGVFDRSSAVVLALQVGLSLHVAIGALLLHRRFPPLA